VIFSCPQGSSHHFPRNDIGRMIAEAREENAAFDAVLRAVEDRARAQRAEPALDERYRRKRARDLAKQLSGGK